MPKKGDVVKILHQGEEFFVVVSKGSKRPFNGEDYSYQYIWVAPLNPSSDYFKTNPYPGFAIEGYQKESILSA